ncbi:MAG: DinB family protein [Nocardioidaceae bacterium]|nr:DinB family protein [Nocardioidaceae bacterium]
MTESSIARHRPPLAADEVSMLRGFLDFFRATVQRQAEGLTQEQLAMPLAPSTMTLGGMLKHLAFVEDWWFPMVMQGRDPQPPFDAADWDSDVDWDWHSAAQDTPAELLALHRRAWESADATLQELLGGDGLDAVAVRARPNGDRVTLRWVLVHMIEEYARHAGHADLIRESIDGATDL